MPKTFLLSPSKRRNLEKFIREELDDSTRMTDSGNESKSSYRHSSLSHSESPSPTEKHSDHVRSLDKPVSNVTAPVTLSAFSMSRSLDEPVMPLTSSFSQPAQFPTSSSSPLRVLSHGPRRLSTGVSGFPSEETPSYLQRQNRLAESFPRASSLTSAFQFVPSIKTGLSYPSHLQRHSVSGFDRARKMSAPEPGVEGRQLNPLEDEVTVGLRTRGPLKSDLILNGDLSPSTRLSQLQRTSTPVPVPSIYPFAYPPMDSYHRLSQAQTSPVVVDSSIPFTTYLQNLIKTLQEAASRAEMAEGELERKENPDKHESGQTEPDSSSAEEIKRAEDSNSNDEVMTKHLPLKRKYNELEDDDDDDDDERKEITVEVQDGEPSSDEERPEAEAAGGRSSAQPMRGKKTLPSLIIPARGHNLKQLQGQQPDSAPVLSTEPLSASPPSLLSSSLSLQQHYQHHHHHHHHHQQQHPQQRHMQNADLKMPSSMLHFPSHSHPQQHLLQHHLQQQHRQHPPNLQYVGSPFYNKIFPPAQLSPQTAHQLSPPGGHQMTIGGALNSVPLSPLAGNIGALFHPSFLGLGGLGMRRASVDKPPPVKKYKCDVCQKAFSRSNTLVTHRRIHTGDKPFKCEVCGRAFRQPGNLTRHRLTHTTHKPYVCHVCSKAFNRASNLNTHIRTHSTFRQFSCSVCPKSFHHKSDLATHVFSHTGERPYKCDVCGRGFSHANTLAAHRRTHMEIDAVTRMPEGQCSTFV